ncbi:MAG TPA: PQQ-dependent sugar dehydrogenase, partial [Acidimicrobiales bacterium]|nr:PQQ-dependent sugar dehydrogenase [Acidimicrobiales bacterium]
AVRLGPNLALPQPSAVADPPGPGPVLVGTLGGKVHLVDLATGAAPVVLDLADRISTGGERGLLGIAVDPRGNRLYADFTDREGDTRIRSWALGSDLRPERGEGIEHLHLPQPYPNHNGGHLVFGPDGALWIGTGDGGSGGDPEDRAQDTTELLGKLLRVVPDPRGGLRAPATNPSWGGPREVWGIGLRNPWRYSFDRATNRLWIADVGQGSIEEVTVVDPTEPAPNFGWDDVEGDEPFEGSARDEFTMPVVTYGHDDGCSITGGYVYRGAAIAGLYGWYLFADYCGGWVRAVPSSDPTRAPTQLLDDVGSVISFAELEDGELLLLTTAGLRRLVA